MGILTSEEGWGRPLTTEEKQASEIKKRTKEANALKAWSDTLASHQECEALMINALGLLPNGAGIAVVRGVFIYRSKLGRVSPWAKRSGHWGQAVQVVSSNQLEVGSWESAAANPGEWFDYCGARTLARLRENGWDAEQDTDMVIRIRRPFDNKPPRVGCRHSKAS